jgi:hypothetical protein
MNGKRAAEHRAPKRATPGGCAVRAAPPAETKDRLAPRRPNIPQLTEVNCVPLELPALAPPTEVAEVCTSSGGPREHPRLQGFTPHEDPLSCDRRFRPTTGA